jgi:hypothetical protein
MPISITGTGTITGISAGGLPDDCITTAEIAASAVTTAKLAQPFTSATATFSTSGTAIDFTGIPSWAKRVTVMLSDVSVSGTSQILIRLGTSSGIVSTGYVSHTALVYGTNLTATATSGSGLILFSDNTSHVRFGNCQICNIDSNTWTASHSLGWQNAIGDVGSVTGGGAISLSGVLDRVRLTTTNGTNTFDSGTVNISYEG